MKIVAFMPAKGTSERIPNKNLAILDGEHLFKRKLRQLLECKYIDEVYLDTDSEEIAELAADLPVQWLKRPSELASNSTDGHAMFAWECSQVKADIYIQTLCTAPFLGADTLSRAIETLLQNSSSDSLVAITRAKQYTWDENGPSYGTGRIPNSTELNQTIIEGMSLYIVRHPRSERPVRRFGVTPTLFELSPLEAVDVNWPEDLALAETIASGMRARENLMLGALTPYLSSAMISDITRELGLQCTLPHEISANKKETRKIFGRAKTLLLAPPQEGQSWRGIYDALNSYDFVRPGDVIMVENKLKNRAYFGNLNASLAMRSGASGAIIDGVTRDAEAVATLGFPVYSRGNYCVDIKFDGTLAAMNKPIEIGGVRIENGDYVMADQDGVTIIPASRWPEVKKLALQSIDREWRVGQAVALGTDAKEIFNQLGEF